MSALTLASLPAPLRSIATQPLFAMRFDVRGPENVGATPGADRRIGVITGGRFEGERLRGEVLDGGSDWQSVRRDGSWTLDVRVVLRTDDGALIGMTYGGVRRGPPEILAALARGEDVDPASYYFRSNPVFETASEKYAWLNGILAIGTGHRFPDGPLYSIFEVL
ncbi:DUF3237 domain-containing protein [Sphingomonas sp. Leaf25]|uniref:DUF3237 domain-containing protein n=1 Tax=Sphingomonas sp. Leaf25 TaxID=1735692 RepID=UPI0006F50600|nr:DUF3237 domain-containing protein [Sphingomonas sp. Leaf25]KQM99396.1 phosphoserine aminotransferase [Sphingomonas sp. Leaf25]